MGERIYLDNASTTFPKPPIVAKAVYSYMTEAGTNIGRGDYSSAYGVEDAVYETRELICGLMGGEDPAQVVFTRNVTESINLLLKGFLDPGDHVVVTSMEHNAVMRPLTQLTAKGITISRAACSPQGDLDPSDIERLITPRTKLVLTTHTSNVCGTATPIREIAKVCRAHGVRFAIDAAQSAGVLPIDARAWGIDAVCFTGHKGLLGPQGIGGIMFTGDFSKEVSTLVAGGTGSSSDLEFMPSFMPDKLEAGTPNLPGIVGLGAGIEWINNNGIDAIREHELALAGRLMEGMAPLEEAGLAIRDHHCHQNHGKQNARDVSHRHYPVQHGLVEHRDRYRQCPIRPSSPSFLTCKFSLSDLAVVFACLNQGVPKQLI